LILCRFQLPETLDAMIITVWDYFKCDRMPWVGSRVSKEATRQATR